MQATIGSLLFHQLGIQIQMTQTHQSEILISIIYQRTIRVIIQTKL